MKNQLKTIVLLGALSAILVAVGANLAPGYVWLFGLIAVGMNLAAYFFSDRIVLRMHHARELNRAEAPELFADVEELARRAGVPMPRLYLIPEDQPNAFATGRNPRHGVVAVTEGILRALGPRELRGVLAHEIAHIRNRDILVASVAAALAALVSQLAQWLTFAGLFGGRSDDEEEGSGAGGLLFSLLAPIAATLVQLAISRSREYLADETGARLTGDPEALAQALLSLERRAELVPVSATPATASLFIVNPLSGGGRAMLRLFSTHPPIEERVRRLRAMAARRT